MVTGSFWTVTVVTPVAALSMAGIGVTTPCTVTNIPQLLTGLQGRFSLLGGSQCDQPLLPLRSGGSTQVDVPPSRHHNVHPLVVARVHCLEQENRIYKHAAM